MKLRLQNHKPRRTTPRLRDKDFPVAVTFTHDMADRQPSRQLVRTVVCPLCHAEPGNVCTRNNGDDRVANHKQRVIAFKALRT